MRPRLRLVAAVFAILTFAANPVWAQSRAPKKNIIETMQEELQSYDQMTSSTLKANTLETVDMLIDYTNKGWGIDMSGVKRFGLGVTLGAVPIAEGKYAVGIDDIYRDSAAARAGIEIGDRLESINGEKIEPFDGSDQALDLVSYRIGEIIRKAPESFSVTVIRDGTKVVSAPAGVGGGVALWISVDLKEWDKKTELTVTKKDFGGEIFSRNPKDALHSLR